jgi:general secretion pathway protein H
MGKPVRKPTSPAGKNDHAGGEDGFTLLEVICVIAIIALIATMTVPMLPRGTSRSRLESYAIETAALLKADRNAAIRRHTETTTQVDAGSRLVHSVATGRTVQVPSDVAFDALLSARCAQRPAGSAVHFFSSGMSCGGVIALTRQGSGYEIRVNWLTGGVDVVALNPS